MGSIVPLHVYITVAGIIIAVGAVAYLTVYTVVAALQMRPGARGVFYMGAVASVVGVGVLGYFWTWALVAYLVVVPLIVVGVMDVWQKGHSILRNFPLLGHVRYLLEKIRPELRQYFMESDQDDTPFSREKRTVVYQRATLQLDTLPFGTQRDVYAVGYEWIGHSLDARAPTETPPRVTIGGRDCTQPYDASLFNISAMSYGALSRNAILALNNGAKKGEFYHNTGEGGLSPFHLEHGGDLVWQVGTGYFGCRTMDGRFDPDAFRDRAAAPSVKMIEIKLSQGAKPGHGGILPGCKVTPEIAKIRGVPVGRDVISPPAHSSFKGPTGLLEFVGQLRALAGGKPVGFKLCIGDPNEFLAICKAMLMTDILPDFVTVDGAEGGTGAAPVEFTNSVGAPLLEGLVFVCNALVGIGVRDRVRIIAAGRIITGFHAVAKMVLGADICNSARGMMFALGCIQARKCNTNHCPVGVATQDVGLGKALHVGDKSERVANFHRGTVESIMELLGGAGLSHPRELSPNMISRRVSATATRTYAEIYDFLEPGALLSEPYPARLDRAWRAADATSFRAAPQPAA